MRRQWLGFAALLVFVAVLVGAGFVGSSDDAGGASTAPIPTLPGAASGPGSDLPNGLSVVEGSALIGSPLPLPPWSSDDGEVALLVVRGDPRTVMRAYVGQAERLGYTMRTRDSLCTAETDNQLGLYACVATGFSDNGYLDLQLGRGHATYGPISHLWISWNSERYPPTGLSEIFGQIPVSDAPDGPAPPPVAKEWPPLATPGDWAFGDSGKPINGYVARSFVVETGSTVAAPVGPSGVLTGVYDWTILLRVDGVPEVVAQRYLRQLNREPGFGQASAKPRVSHPERGVTVYELDAESLGDANHFFTIVERPGGSWMLVSGSAQT